MNLRPRALESGDTYTGPAGNSNGDFGLHAQTLTGASVPWSAAWSGRRGPAHHARWRQFIGFLANHTAIKALFPQLPGRQFLKAATAGGAQKSVKRVFRHGVQVIRGAAAGAHNAPEGCRFRP